MQVDPANVPLPTPSTASHTTPHSSMSSPPSPRTQRIIQRMQQEAVALASGSASPPRGRATTREWQELRNALHAMFRLPSVPIPQALQGQAPPSDSSPGTSKTLHIPSIVGECNKPTSSTLKRQDMTILYLAHPQPSWARNPPRQYLLSRPHLSRPPVPSRIAPGSTHQG